METEANTKVYKIKKKINQALEEQFSSETKVYHPIKESEPVKPVVIKPILPVSKPLTRKEDKITVLKHKKNKVNFLEWIDDHSWKIGILIPLCFVILMSLVVLIR